MPEVSILVAVYLAAVREGDTSTLLFESCSLIEGLQELQLTGTINVMFL